MPAKDKFFLQSANTGDVLIYRCGDSEPHPMPCNPNINLIDCNAEKLYGILGTCAVLQFSILS